MTAPFAAEPLIDAARRRGAIDAGLADQAFSDELVEALTVVCDALEHTAELDGPGRAMTARYLDRLLDGRLAIEQYLHDDPGTVQEHVAAPIIVIGPPRSGTTAMHRLLGSVDGHRVAEGWEFWQPVPPPEADTHDDDPRIDLAAEELGFPQARAAGLARIHTYSSRMPKECLSAMAFSLRTEEFISRYHVPAYVEWLQQCDMSPAYEMHRRVLQILQRRMPGRRWVLKSPVHLQAIPLLVATYPDARFVVTHRDPNGFLASVSSLIETLRSAFSSRHDPEAIGAYHLDLYARSLDALVDHVDGGVLPPDQTVHVRHRDIVSDAPRVVGDALHALDIDVDDAMREQITEVAGLERADALGGHTYDAATFGLDDEGAVDAGFARYRARFLG